MEILALTNLSYQDVLDRIRAALTSVDVAGTIAEYVSTIDWSGMSETSPAGALLGEVENLTDGFVEGDIVERDYIQGLRSLAARDDAGTRRVRARA